MNREMLREFITNYKSGNDSTVPYNKSNIIFWLENFLDSLDEDAEMTTLNQDKDILQAFSSYLKGKTPELHEKIFIENKYFQTPKELWELLCLSGEPTAISYLIDKKIINEETVNPNGMNALHLTALAGNKKGMQKTIDIGIKSTTTENGLNVLHFAARSGNTESMQFVVDRGIVPAVPITTSKITANILLHFAARSGSVSAMKYVHEELKMNPQDQDEHGGNVLHYAASSGNADAMKYAVSLGINPLEKAKNGITLLHFAARSGSVSAMKYAIDLGVNPLEKNQDGRSIIDYAANSNNTEAIKYAQELTPKVMRVGQNWFINLLQNMGYKGDEKGMCLGVTYMAMQAVLAEEADKFDSRLELIHQYAHAPDQLKKEIEDAKNAIKKKEAITNKQKEFLDIQAFFEGIELFQLGYTYSDDILKHKYRQSEAIRAVLPLLTPLKLEKNNGHIEHIQDFRRKYKDKHIDAFLDKLKEMCLSEDFPGFPLSICLSKATKENGHAINISYDPKEKSWVFVDANQLPMEKFSFDDLDMLKIKIKNSLSIVKDDVLLSHFNANMYIHNDDHKKDVISKFISNMRKEFPRDKPRSLMHDVSKFFDKLVGEDTKKEAFSNVNESLTQKPTNDPIIRPNTEETPAPTTPKRNRHRF